MALRTSTSSKYRWNETARRYIDARGRFVSQATIRAELDVALKSASVRVRALAEQLVAGEITVPEWEIGMRQISKEVHVYSATAARGGFAQLTQADYGRIGRVVRGEYAWIRNLRTEITEAKKVPPRFLSRVQLYTQAGRETYHKVERQVELEKGNTLERNVLAREAVHCRGPSSCPHQTERGWVVVGQLIPIGQRNCFRNCKCTIEYSSVNAMADDAGVPDDHPKPKPESPYKAKYASAVMDMETCDHCAAFDGVVVAVEDPRQLPDHGCTSARGCQCVWVMINKEEGTVLP
jgi:hypothetical protein